MIASCSQLVDCRAKMDSIPGDFLLPSVILVAYSLVTVWKHSSVKDASGSAMDSVDARCLLHRSDW